MLFIGSAEFHLTLWLFHAKAGRPCYIKYTRSQETNLGFSVKICLTDQQRFVFKEKGVRLLRNKALLDVVALFVQKDVEFRKDTVTL